MEVSQQCLIDLGVDVAEGTSTNGQLGYRAMAAQNAPNSVETHR